MLGYHIILVQGTARVKRSFPDWILRKRRGQLNTTRISNLAVSRIVFSRGGALPVIMSIIGPREPHDYRELNL